MSALTIAEKNDMKKTVQEKQMWQFSSIIFENTDRQISLILAVRNWLKPSIHTLLLNRSKNQDMKQIVNSLMENLYVQNKSRFLLASAKYKVKSKVDTEDANANLQKTVLSKFRALVLDSKSKEDRFKASLLWAAIAVSLLKRRGIGSTQIKSLIHEYALEVGGKIQADINQKRMQIS